MIDWIKTVRGRRVRQKAAASPEYVAILHAARALGHPVKWCDERADSFLLDQQGRGTVVDAELGARPRNAKLRDSDQHVVTK
jgi:CO/xanthine dehydrogenase Mo-binding subunit